MNMKKKITIIGVITVIILISLAGAYYFLNWAYSDQKFSYGDLNFWLLTDKEFREFPVIGAKRNDVNYKSFIQDGTSPAMLILSYGTSMSPDEVLDAYKSFCHQNNYESLSTESGFDNWLNYKGKGEYERITILVEKTTEGSKVTVHFIMKLGV